MNEGCELIVEGEGDKAQLRLRGRLDAHGAASVWQKARDAVRKAPKAVLDVSGLDYCDGAGLSLLLDLRRGSDVKIEGLKPEYKKLWDIIGEQAPPKDLEAPVEKRHWIWQIGHAGFVFATDLRALVAFLGQVSILLVRAVFNPRLVRWKDMWNVVETAGPNALFIVMLIGFLMGLILAFQSTVPLQQFGVDIYVVNLTALAMFRELGPIMTAIVLAGRSGSAFAAEIGTMKVNEEIDALRTMGIDPVQFLVLPRVIAAVMITPILTIFANLAGIMGGLFVVALMGHPWAAIYHQLVSAVGISDIFSGLIKAFVFGILVAGVGCLRGLQTESGSIAVGVSTTRAVVSAIILIIFTDAIFSVVFYVTGF